MSQSNNVAPAETDRVSTRSVLFNLKPSDLPVHVHEHVRWGDMDAFAHMNNTVFFQLFESARMAYFNNIHFTDPADHDGIGPILAHTECFFTKPLTYPQSLTVGTRITSLQEDRFVMHYGVFIEGDKPALAACGTAKVVCFDYVNNIKASIPESVAKLIRTLEGDDLNSAQTS